MKNIAACYSITISFAVSLAAVTNVLAADKNPLLPPSMRQATEQTVKTTTPELSSADAKNYRLFQEWQKTKGSANADYQEFLLWLEFQKQTQVK